MTTHVSKEQLGLMLPGTMNHHQQDEPEYLEPPQPGLLALLAAAVGGWFVTGRNEATALSPTQLADIGMTRGDGRAVFGGVFADQGRMLAALQTGRFAGA